MGLTKLLLITIVVITTMAHNTIGGGAPPPSTRPSRRFLAQNEVAARKPNAADHCIKNPEICNSIGLGGGSNSRMSCCNNKCIDVLSDDSNCGACKNKCKFSQTCCRGQCVNLDYDTHHCGQCNHACDVAESCLYGICNYA